MHLFSGPLNVPEIMSSDLNDIEIGTLPQLCCCITNILAAIIIAILSILARLTCIIIFFVTFFAYEVELHSIYYIATTIFTIAIIFDILLLYGCIREKIYLVLPWFFVGLTTAAVLLLIALFEKDVNVVVTSLSVVQALVHIYLPFIILYASAEIFDKNRTHVLQPAPEPIQPK